MTAGRGLRGVLFDLDGTLPDAAPDMAAALIAERDVQAARNAGMIPLVAGFGYLGGSDDPAAWRAVAVFARPEELVDWLGLGR